MNQANGVVQKKSTQEGMNRNPHSSNKIRLEDDDFLAIGGRKPLTCCGAPSGGRLIEDDALNHHPVEICFGAGRCDPTSSCLISVWLRFFGAMCQI